MGILTSIGKAVAGDAISGWLKAAALPVAFTVAVTGWHQFTKAREEAKEARDATMVARGRQQCIAEIELTTAKAEAAAMRQRAETAQAEAAAAIEVNQEIRGNEDRIKSELVRVQQIADRNAAECGPDRRLSDGVLDLIGGHQGVAGQGQGRKGR